MANWKWIPLSGVLLSRIFSFLLPIQRGEKVMEDSAPKVCIGVSTFNQVRYIRDALDSVLAQQADFDFEVVVHDDASTDGTREIIERYAAANPKLIRAVFQEENQYQQGRRIILILLSQMRGRYFAFLDGDDFWTNPKKLQVQANFLDQHPDCALCQTQTIYFNERLQRPVSLFPPLHRRRERFECGDLACGNFIQTSAVMFRASAVPQIPPEFDSLKFGDYPLFAMLAMSGWIGNIPKAMVLYRIHEGNMWNGQPRSLSHRGRSRKSCNYLAQEPS